MNTPANDPTPTGSPTAPARLADDLAAAAGEAGQMLKDFSDRRLRDAREAIGDLQSAATGHAKGISTVADDYAHRHPWHVVGAAAVAGVVLGLLLSRR